MTTQQTLGFKPSTDRLSRTRCHWPFVLLLALYVATTVWLSFRLPAFVAPNEQLHYEYVALLRRTGQLPDPTASARPDERHQPPIYYMLAALLSLPFPSPLLDTELETNPYFFDTHEGNRNPAVGVTAATVPVLYAGRLASVSFGTVSLVVIYSVAYHVFRNEVALLITSLIAFQPMFLFLSAAVNNDLAVTATSTLVIAWTTLLIAQQRAERSYLLWGVLFAIAVLTKVSAVFLAVLLPIACLSKWRSQGRFWGAVRCGLIGVLGFVPLFMSWVLTNIQRHLDAVAVSASLPSLDRVLSVRPDDLTLLQPYLHKLWRTFLLDWSQNETGYTSDWLYWAWGIALIIALVGWLRRPDHLQQNKVLPLMHIAWTLPLVLFFVVVKTLMIKEAGFLTPEGRWLLPILPSLAWLAASGWSRWWPARWLRYVAIGTSGIVVASSLALVILFLPELYPGGAQHIASVSSIPVDVHPVGFVYNQQIELIGIKSTPFDVDQKAEVTLYWQALQSIDANYGVSSALVVPAPGGWKRLDLQRSFPGNGLTPTRGWQAGDVYQDRVVFYPRDELHGPTIALISVDLLDGRMALPVTHDGAPVDVAVVQEVIVRPSETLSPTARLTTTVNFGGLFDLTGITYAHTNHGLQVTLWWQATAKTQTSYTVFIHLVGLHDRLVAQADGLPNDGLSPTNIWQPNDVIQDIHSFPVQAPPQSTLLIGVYDLATLNRLPAVQGNHPLLSDAFRFELH